MPKCTRCKKEVKKRYPNTGLCMACGKMAKGTQRKHWRKK